MTSKTTIFPTNKIITMYPEQPFASAVAVKDGRILAVGELEDVTFLGKNSAFSPFKDIKVLETIIG